MGLCRRLVLQVWSGARTCWRIYAGKFQQRSCLNFRPPSKRGSVAAASMVAFRSHSWRRIGTPLRRTQLSAQKGTSQVLACMTRLASGQGKAFPVRLHRGTPLQRRRTKWAPTTTDLLAMAATRRHIWDTTLVVRYWPPTVEPTRPMGRLRLNFWPQLLRRCRLRRLQLPRRQTKFRLRRQCPLKSLEWSQQESFRILPLRRRPGQLWQPLHRYRLLL